MGKAALTVFQDRAGDRNDLAIKGAASIARHLGYRLKQDAFVVGHPEPALNADWKVELAAAMPALQSMSMRYDTILKNGRIPITANSRCAVSLATLPVVAKYFPKAKVVWFDSHADLNTPQTTRTGYLGGLALAGPCGLWNSGLGAGLELSHVVLVGGRDFDPAEQDMIARKECHYVPHQEGFLQVLDEFLDGSEVYVHIDCDVLKPGTVPTLYKYEGGLTFVDLYNACSVIARNQVVGFEIAEFQDSWEVGGEPVSPQPLLNACEPLIKVVTGEK